MVSFIYGVVYLVGTVSFGIPRLLCASFGITRLIRVFFEITRLICESEGITRLIEVCVLWNHYTILCKGNARGRPTRGKKDADKHVETDDVLIHPVDAEGWKHFDFEFPDFASVPRNMRLGLASDEFNPFGPISTSYSMWPIVLLPYKLPP
ncbi:uncharacterized protein E5676_scaffold343G00030 [Cucumis melo var. makuwa]|uniref:Transposase n=1 Tax=Cucumis melo var. makuwa TaxID=1194695 RepID=A0A5A7SJG6_CUCMM|nr:uncharacterized protein E6C27_scaffold19G002700 [Cucumis melo var. makuwa]TYK30688.1 uncharacterized protein E5676_scaffold343G00030 [Cucumis melo var. makuwa]